MKLPWIGSRESRPHTRRFARRIVWFFRRTRRPAAAPLLLLPEVHVYENEKVIQVRVEGHDLDPKKLQIHRRENSLTISGVVRTDPRSPLRLYRRSIVLPPNVEAAAITAKIHRDFLLIRIPKRPASPAPTGLTTSETL
jgi:HSP20 family molecular chaperone IbpA